MELYDVYFILNDKGTMIFLNEVERLNSMERDFFYELINRISLRSKKGKNNLHIWHDIEWTPLKFNGLYVLESILNKIDPENYLLCILGEERNHRKILGYLFDNGIINVNISVD